MTEKIIDWDVPFYHRGYIVEIVWYSQGDKKGILMRSNGVDRSIIPCRTDDCSVLGYFTSDFEVTDDRDGNAAKTAAKVGIIRAINRHLRELHGRE